MTNTDIIRVATTRRRHSTPIEVMTDVAQRQLAMHGIEAPRSAVEDAIRNALQAVQP